MSTRELPVLPVRGRGAPGNPSSRFERLTIEIEPEASHDSPAPKTQLFRDTSRSIVSRNDSPDVGFSLSVNPYRGCEHGCIYCYARPTHEYFGLSAGLDFETRIFVKENAPALLRKALSAPRWKPAPIAMSGVTDPYQPIERRLEITRGCLEVLREFGNPVGIITKNHLVTRDIDLIAPLAAEGAAVVHLSVTSLDARLQRVMEPRTSSPDRRLAAIEKLSAAGIPVGVMIAPVVPGLTDHEIPAILEAAAAAGATSAGFIPLRLPYGVAPLFESWLDAHFPERKSKVLGRVREIRGGRLNDARFGSRMRGEGEYAGQLRALFDAARVKYGIAGERPRLSIEAWRGPPHRAEAAPEQLSLL